MRPLLEDLLAALAFICGWLGFILVMFGLSA